MSALWTTVIVVGAAHRAGIALSAPARLMEELYKLLRSGSAERAFRMLAERRLLEPMAPELQRGATERLVRVTGRIVDPKAFAEIPVAVRRGTPIRIGDVATVVDGCVGCGLCGENAHAASLTGSTRQATMWLL